MNAIAASIIAAMALTTGGAFAQVSGPPVKPCPLQVRTAFAIAPAKDTLPDRAAIVVTSETPVKISGKVRVYADFQRLSADLRNLSVGSEPTPIFINVIPPREIDGFDFDVAFEGGACELQPSPIGPSPPLNSRDRALVAMVRNVLNQSNTTAGLMPTTESIPPPTCGTIYDPAKILERASPSRTLRFTGAAQVVVALRPDGSVEDASLYRASQSPDLDMEAVRVARATKYASARYRCRPIRATYIFLLQMEPRR